MAEAPGLLLLNAEDNSLAGLTITQEGSNVLSIASGAAAHGSLGYNFAFSGNAGENLLHAYKSFTAGTDIYGRCYFYIPSSFDMSVSQLQIFGLKYSTSAFAAAPYFTRDGSANITLYRFYYYINTGVTFQAITPITITRNTWHTIEMRYKSGAGDGVATLWLDGTQITTLTGLTNNNFQAGYIHLGNSGGAVPTAGSVIYVDDAKIDSSPIGVYTEESSGINISGNYYRGIMQ